MRVYDLFSKRNSPPNVNDVYKYDDVPQKLRVQIVHIIKDAYGETDFDKRKTNAFKEIFEIICREEGLFKLVEYPRGFENDVLNYFLSVGPYDKALDVVEVCFRYLPTFTKSLGTTTYARPRIKINEAIDELNHRFKEAGIGYQFAGQRIIKFSDTFTHAEIVTPTLQLLASQKYEGINEEFIGAHIHFRNGKYKECLNDCLKAFESTLKVICKEKNWPVGDKDTVQALIKTVLDNKLIPEFMQSNIGAIRSVLESGIPTIRNRLSGHGQGEKAIEVDEYVAHYALNLTASTILMLFEAKAET